MMQHLPQEIIEGIGYPGQKNSHGGLVTLGRIYYGPGRYDYGRPKMPKGWLANFFYPLWEFGASKAVLEDHRQTPPQEKESYGDRVTPANLT